jgi:hypothetical protein
MAYELDTGYKITSWIGHREEVDEALYALLGISESSGSGFGMRDNQWQFESETEAVAAKAKVDALPFTFEYVSVAELTEDEV